MHAGLQVSGAPQWASWCSKGSQCCCTCVLLHGMIAGAGAGAGAGASAAAQMGLKRAHDAPVAPCYAQGRAGRGRGRGRGTRPLCPAWRLSCGASCARRLTRRQSGRPSWQVGGGGMGGCAGWPPVLWVVGADTDTIECCCACWRGDGAAGHRGRWAAAAWEGARGGPQCCGWALTLTRSSAAVLVDVEREWQAIAVAGERQWRRGDGALSPLRPKQQPGVPSCPPPSNLPNPGSSQPGLVSRHLAFLHSIFYDN